MRYTWMLPCAVLGGVLMAACQVLIYRYAPVEQTMGLVQKIFYTHLPLAWWSFVSFFLVCVSGVAYLKTRNRHWDAMAGAAAEVGVVLSGLALVSGSIWARHSWGVWWTWDPRLTTTMILWFLYAGYLVLRKMDMPRERQANLCAVVGIVAFVDVPLVFLSARLWRSIHPAVFANKSGGLEPEMKIAAKEDPSVRYSLGILYAYYLEQPDKGLEQLQKALDNPNTPADLKKAVAEEVTKIKEHKNHTPQQAQ